MRGRDKGRESRTKRREIMYRRTDRKRENGRGGERELYSPNPSETSGTCKCRRRK